MMFSARRGGRMCSTPYGLIKKTHDLGHGAKIKSGRSAVPLNGFTGESRKKKKWFPFGSTF